MKSLRSGGGLAPLDFPIFKLPSSFTVSKTVLNEIAPRNIGVFDLVRTSFGCARPRCTSLCVFDINKLDPPERASCKHRQQLTRLSSQKLRRTVLRGVYAPVNFT